MFFGNSLFYKQVSTHISFHTYNLYFFYCKINWWICVEGAVQWLSVEVERSARVQWYWWILVNQCQITWIVARRVSEVIIITEKMFIHTLTKMQCVLTFHLPHWVTFQCQCDGTPQEVLTLRRVGLKWTWECGSLKYYNRLKSIPIRLSKCHVTFICHVDTSLLEEHKYIRDIVCL